MELKCSPVLLIIYNKPNITLKVIREILKAYPEKLYIFGDAPRLQYEKEIIDCFKTRKLIDSFDFGNTVVKKHYNKTNSGSAANGVSSAVEWFFEQEDEGIILESDCLPGSSFFRFASELLEKYRNDEKVMHISGNNFQTKFIDCRHSYYFSNIPFIWGWATWKRAWKQYDVKIESYPEFKKFAKIENYFLNKEMRNFWVKKFDGVYSQKIDTWDYQWTYSILKNDGLSITPNYSLVTNIGFDEQAMNTKYDSYGFSKFGIKEVEEIKFNDLKAPNKKADYENFKYALSPGFFRKVKIKSKDIFYNIFH